MAIHANWNPWHGCIKCSEGCEHCYVYYLDKHYGRNGADVYKTKTNFRYPLSKDRQGRYKIQSGELISVCMTSDFFLEEADEWRDEAWDMIRKRSDVAFLLLTKRPQRVMDCLPADWGDGWDNVFFNVCAENQKRADERIPLLLELPFKHKGLHLAPLLGPIKLGEWLDTGQIEQVACGGENYGGRRPCDFDWVQSLHDECVERDITFCFMETGTTFIKDGTTYTIRSKADQNEQAFKSGMAYQGKEIQFNFVDSMGMPIPKDELYVKHYVKKCETCTFKLICNGCSDCGNCEE